MPTKLDQARELARVVFARERLGTAHPPAEDAPPRPGFLRQLFAREELALDPELPKETRPSLASRLFGFESLPEEPAAPPRRRLPLLTWWLLPERLDEEK